MIRAGFEGGSPWGRGVTPRWNREWREDEPRYKKGAGDEISEEDHLTARAYSFASVVWNRVWASKILWSVTGPIRLTGGGPTAKAGPLARLLANTIGDLDPGASTRIREALRQVNETGQRGARLDQQDVREAVQSMQTLKRYNVAKGMGWARDQATDRIDPCDPSRRAADRLMRRWSEPGWQNFLDIRPAWPYWVMEIEYSFASARERPMLYHQMGWWMCKAVMHTKLARDKEEWWPKMRERIGEEILWAKERPENNATSSVPWGQYFWVRDPLGRVIPRRLSGQLKWLGGRRRASGRRSTRPGVQEAISERPAA